MLLVEGDLWNLDTIQGTQTLFHEPRINTDVHFERPIDTDEHFEPRTNTDGCRYHEEGKLSAVSSQTVCSVGTCLPCGVLLHWGVRHSGEPWIGVQGRARESSQIMVVYKSCQSSGCPRIKYGAGLSSPA